jgi:hypothetical protein
VAQENIELKFIRHTRPAELALSVPEFPCCAKQKSRLDGFGRLFSWWGRRAVFGGLPAAVLVQFLVPMLYLLFKAGGLH